ncbi:MAG: hypothetical protein ABIP06_14600 [Pyrinomonadaceae bacterium]
MFVKNDNVVPFEKTSRPINLLPEMFADENFKIGIPSSAFDGQSDSLIGKALPDLNTTETAGATLSAVGSMRSDSTLPEFTSWNVEPDRVEPHLVTITHPHSTFCEEDRSLRTQIIHKSQCQKLQSIVIASINAIQNGGSRLGSP